MKLKNILFVLTLLSVFVINGCRGKNDHREDTSMVSSEKFYRSEWEEVEKLRQKSMPESALKAIDSIYQDAFEKKNIPHYLKAVIYKVGIIKQKQEESIYNAQQLILEELEKAPFPSDAVLHSMAAQLYWEYFVQNRYRFYNRTETVETSSEDMRTWPLEKLIDRMTFHYTKSVENARQLQNIPVESLEPVVTIVAEGTDFRPTLYDLLAHRALDFYMRSESGLTKPASGFTLNEAAYLDKNSAFVKVKLDGDDEDSFDYRALTLLQNLIKFHLDDKDAGPLLDVDLKRLRFVYSNAVISGKEKLMENVLSAMIKRYRKDNAVSLVYAELANFYFTLGSSYRPGGNEEYRDYLKKALEICEQTIADYPKEYAADLCRNLQSRIYEKSLNVTAERYYIPGKPLRALVTYRNTPRMFVRVIKTSLEELGDQYNRNFNKLAASLRTKKPHLSFSVDLDEAGDHQTHSTEFSIDALSPGVYVLLTADNDEFDIKENTLGINLITLTDIAYIKRVTSARGLEFQLFHRDSGAPLSGCEAQIYYAKYNNVLHKYERKKGPLLTADKKGYLLIESRSVNSDYYEFFIDFKYNGQHFNPDESLYLPNRYDTSSRSEAVYFFTDRSIYRPGQTLYFKGILLDKDSLHGENSKIIPNSPVVVNFYDVNGQNVDQLQLTTNEYGTFAGAFRVPTGVLTGTMQLSTPFGSQPVQVEEYKRPGFEVTFDHSSEEFQLEKKVTLTGKASAFGGFGIDNARVNYRVVRNVFYPYHWYYMFYMPPTPSAEIVNAVTTTGSDGSFSVTFDALPDLTISKEYMPAYIYTVYADITDLNGETRSSQKAVTIGYTSLVLTANIPEVIDKDAGSAEYGLNSTNLSSEFLSASGKITFYKLEEPDRPLRTRLWDRPDVFITGKTEHDALFPHDVYDDEDIRINWKREKKVLQTAFNTADSLKGTLTGLSGWEEGVYLAEMTAKDSLGNSVKDIKVFTLTSSSAGTVPYKTHSWFAPLKTDGEPGDAAVFLVGCSGTTNTVLFEIEHRGEIVKREYLELNNEQKKIVIPITEKHRGNFTVHFSRIIGGRSYVDTRLVRVPWSNKELDISFETFRSRLSPGEDEEWRIRIKGKGKDRIAAEMAAALYDSSLDQYRAHDWYYSFFPELYSTYIWQTESVANVSRSIMIGYYRRDIYPVKHITYNYFDWFGMIPVGPAYLESMTRDEPVLRRSFDTLEESEKMLDDQVEYEMTTSEDTAVPMAPDEAPTDTFLGGQEGQAEEVQVRTNFAETAFFFPQLKTDSEGEIIIAFTIPESLTRWKMLGFAHTKNLEYGYITKELVTRKELMVLPNTPRFLREGDTIEFSAKITNQSEQDMTGKATLSLFDPATMESLDARFDLGRPDTTFSAPEGESTRVSWRLKVPEGVEAVTYRITARSGSFSDGEEAALPVLKNRMLVTETLPLPVSSNSSASFSFASLADSGTSDTLKHHKLTLEFTSNPAWYAVQALPYIMEYPYECFEQTFSRYYANILAAHIAGSNPKIAEIFTKWRETPGSNALLSNLEKNQELKSLLLEETPWVLDAQDETERKRRVAQLFDIARVAGELETTLKKLIDGQDASGGWPWFKGMYPNRYITGHIVAGFGHLDRLGVVNIQEHHQLRTMIEKALDYLDREIADDYKRLQNSRVNLNVRHIGYTQIHYLYTRSFFNDLPIKGSKKAYEYYVKQARDYQTEFNTYARGMIALTLSRKKDNAKAREIIASIKEHALYSDEMGMYWKESHGYYWYDAGVEMQALLIEAFLEITADTEAVEKMQTWLLKNKQTRNWRTTKATVEACYALLIRGTDLLSETKLPDITIGNKKIDPVGNDSIDYEEGTGYFKTSWGGTEISSDMARVTINNHNKVPAWGGLYWQYFEQLDKISFAKTNLSLQKELFIEVSSKTGPVLVPLAKRKARIGDRIIVVINLVSDRDMEYVHMKDMRASAFEPENVISGYRWQDGLGYYESTRDGSTNFFFDFLPKGTYRFQYPLRVTHEGDFSTGIATISCMYAPEFTSHSEGIRVKIGGK